MNNTFILVLLNIYQDSICLVPVRNASNWCKVNGTTRGLLTGVFGLKEPH